MCTADFTHYPSCGHSVLVSNNLCHDAQICHTTGRGIFTNSVPPQRPCPCTSHPIAGTLTFPHDPTDFGEFCVARGIRINDVRDVVPGWIFDLGGRKIGSRLRPWRPVQFIVAYYRARERMRRGIEREAVALKAEDVEQDVERVRVHLSDELRVKFKEEDEEEKDEEEEEKDEEEEEKDEKEVGGDVGTAIKIEMKIEEDGEWEITLEVDIAALASVALNVERDNIGSSPAWATAQPRDSD